MMVIVDEVFEASVGLWGGRMRGDDLQESGTP